MIDHAKANEKPIVGQGHLHYQLDNGPVIATPTPKLSFHGLTPGVHTIVVTLTGNDHKLLGPQQKVDGDSPGGDVGEALIPPPARGPLGAARAPLRAPSKGERTGCMRDLRQQEGAIGYILLWVLGHPHPDTSHHLLTAGMQLSRRSTGQRLRVAVQQARAAF